MSNFSEQSQLFSQLSFNEISPAQAEFIMDSLAAAGFGNFETLDDIYKEYFAENSATRKEWKNSKQALSFWSAELFDTAEKSLIEMEKKQNTDEFDEIIYNNLWLAFELLDQLI